MIATGGFGAFPDNPLTQNFQEVISENISADYLEPFNAYMENISAPTIQPQFDSGSENPFDPIGTFVGVGNPTIESVPTLSMAEINTSIAEFSASMTAVSAGTATAAATLNTPTQSPTTTFIPTVTPLPSITSTPTLVPTATFVWIYVSPTKTLKPTKEEPPATTTPATITPAVTTTPATLTPAPSIVLYEGSSSDGNIGSRGAADALCVANLPSGYSNYRAFISFSQADDIYDLASNYNIPTSYLVKSSYGVTIANNWADMFDGSIDMSMSDALVTYSDWWSGVEDDGQALATSANCFAWTDNTASPTNNGNVGSSTIITAGSGTSWLKGQSSGVACDVVRPVLCIGY